MNTTNVLTRYPWIKWALVFIFVNTFGFPGSYTRVFGQSMKPLVEYTTFALELLMMATANAGNVLEVKLFEFDERCRPLYLLVLEFGITSMIASSSKSTEIVSCIRLFITAMFAIWICRNIGLKDLLEIIYRAQILFVIASVAFPLLFPQYDIRTSSYQNTFVGIGGVKNVVGLELAFGIIIQYLLYQEKKEKQEPVSVVFIGMLIAQIALLISTDATGAMVVAVLPIVFLQLTKNGTRPAIPWGVMYIAASAGFLLIALTCMPLFEPLLNALGKDATLTGRIPLWRQLIEVMQQHNTLFGFGYGRFWFDERAVAYMHEGFEQHSFMANMTSGAHNNIMELLANNGILGVATFFLVMFIVLEAINRLDTSHYRFTVAFVILYTVIGCTERTWTTFEYMTLFLFITLGTILINTRKENSVCLPSAQLLPPMNVNGP